MCHSRQHAGTSAVCKCAARSFWDRAVALVVPPRCVCCDGPAAPGAFLCEVCREALGRLPAGTSAARRGGELAGHFAAFPMAGPARDLVHALKFRRLPAAAGPMAELLASRLPARYLEGALLVPVPAHPARRRERGFNQSALLARRLAEIHGVPVCDCLSRAAAGPSQTGRSREERLRLPDNAVYLRNDTTSNCRQLAQLGADVWTNGQKIVREGYSIPTHFPTNVVLMDDVATTGVTLEVCAKAIRTRFRSDVRAVTFASTSAEPGGNAEGQTAGG